MNYETLNSDERANLVESVYTPISLAIRTLHERQSDLALKKKVDDFFLEHGVPKPLLDDLRSVVSRCIATPNFEMKYFLELSDTVGLKPLILEYPGKFVNVNPDKYHLAKMYFVASQNRHLVIEKKNIIDFNITEGKYFSEINTLTGESIIDFHHRLFEKVHDDDFVNIHDFSEWFDKTKNTQDMYYFVFFSLFITNGILFENYFSQDKAEYDFFCKNIIGSFNKVEEYFGVRPLIVPLLPLRNELAKEWLWYDISIRNFI